MNFIAFNIQDVGAQATVAALHLLAEDGGLHDQIDGDVVFEDPDVIIF